MSGFKLCGRAAAKELSTMVKEMTPEQKEAFQKICDWHKRWYYVAGHKILGRKLNDGAEHSDVETLRPDSSEIQEITGNGGYQDDD